MNQKHLSQSGGRPTGFTLVEIMTVTVIILVLAMLIFAGITSIGQKSVFTKCASVAKSIGTATKTYANDWQGWLNPNGDAFPAALNYPLYDLSSLLGAYNTYRSLTRGVNDFRCPADPSPRLMRSGYETSYQVSSFFIGKNLMRLPGKTVLLHEMVDSHPSRGRMGGTYLYSDLSCELSGQTQNSMPGLVSRWWDGTTGPVGKELARLVWSGDLVHLQSERLWILPTIYHMNPPAGRAIGDRIDNWNLLDNSGNPVSSEPNTVFGRWDGYLDFPSSGAWTIDAAALTPGVVSIQADCDGDGTLELVTPLGTARSATANIGQAGRYKVRFEYQKTVITTTLHEFRFCWQGPGGNPPRETIPLRRIWHIPYQD
jgi:prepilin-type N-terminal cleavage/methylation domain-containing protein